MRNNSYGILFALDKENGGVRWRFKAYRGYVFPEHTTQIKGDEIYLVCRKLPQFLLDGLAKKYEDQKSRELALPKLLKTLSASPFDDEAEDARTALAFFGKHALGPLQELLKDQDDLARQCAILALKKLGQIAAEPLAESLLDANETVRSEAVQALIELGAGSIPALTQALHHPNVQLRRQAAWVFIQWSVDLKEIAREVMPALIGALGDPDANVRSKIAWTLGRMGNSAISAKPALEERIEDSDSLVRDYVREALKTIQNP